MKKNLFVCLFVCLFASNYVTLANGDEEQLRFREIFFFTQNAQFPVISTRIKLTSISNLWDKINQQGVHPITTSFSEAYYDADNNETKQHWNGFDFVTSIGNDTPPSPIFTYGLYKVSFEKKVLDELIPLPNYFYIDYRDTRAPYVGVAWQGFDIWIKYDYLNQSVKITQRDDLIGDGEDGSHWITVQNGDYIKIWEIQQQGTPSTSNFQNYWSNCLSAIQKYNSENFLVPFIIWGPTPNFSATGYKIYRTISPSGLPPGSFSLIATVNSNTFTYLDESLLVNGNQVAYYKVKAYNNSTESDYTNIANISVSGFYKKSIGDNKIIPGKFYLNQNYPNPFNSSTEIRYSIPVPEQVKIIVTDILGKEITTLIDAYQTEGEHIVKFNASELPSGIYFYKIYAGSFIETKKMIYLR